MILKLSNLNTKSATLNPIPLAPHFGHASDLTATQLGKKNEKKREEKVDHLLPLFKWDLFFWLSHALPLPPRLVVKLSPPLITHTHQEDEDPVLFIRSYTTLHQPSLVLEKKYWLVRNKFTC